MLLLAWPIHGHSSPGCFSLADNYYEQVFCELEAAGKGYSLPAWFEFRRNPEQTQALLLKPIARKAGIVLKMPKVEHGNGDGGNQRDDSTNAMAPSASALGSTAAPLHRGVDCQYREGYLNCGRQRYRFASNRPNGELAEGVLDADYQMDIPGYKGEIDDPLATRTYLKTAYQKYLSKMIAIGLSEVTLPYFKFERIFYDLAVKNVDFTERFERMFFYLKKDKKNMAVAVAPSPPEGFSGTGCTPVSDALISCFYGQRNYVFYKP